MCSNQERANKIYSSIDQMQEHDIKEHLDKYLRLEERQPHLFLYGLGQTLVDLVQIESDGINSERDEHHDQLRIEIHVYERATRQDRDEKHEHV